MWSSRHPRYGRGVAAVLDDFLPDAPYRTRYATTIATDAEATWRALRAITARDLALTRILVAVRRMSLSTLRPDDDETDQPLLETFVERDFTALREDEPDLGAGHHRAAVAAARTAPRRRARRISRATTSPVTSASR